MGMSDQREKAQRLSEYVDSLVLAQRYEHRGSEYPPADREFHELRALAQSLAGIAIEPPVGFAENLARRLPALAAETTFRTKLSQLWTRARSGEPVVRSLSPALTAAITVLALALVLRAVVDVPVVSASEILTRSDAALVGLVKPGQLLYRRWRVTSTTIDRDGAQQQGRTRTIREWMDGADYDRVAGRWSSADDRLLIGYTSIGPDGEQRPHVYFSPGVFGEARGLFSIEPTADEFKGAVRQFADPVRRELDVYLRRQSIYLPIVGERMFNRAVIDAARQADADPARVVLSFDRAEMNGTPVYRVRVMDPAAIDFNWRSDGPPRVRLVSAERVRYIARDSYLSMRTEDTLTFEDGRRRFTTRELVETRAIPTANLSLDPFRLEIPEGTPVQRQSAVDHLSAVAQAFGRLLPHPTTTQ
jgi:hypothetical protein